MGIPRLAVILTAVGCISGCVSAYVPPASGDVAQITFNRYQDSTTAVQIYDVAQTCTSRHGVALLRSDSKKSIAVRAGAPVSVTMSVDHAVIPLPVGFIVRGCNPTITFTPEKDATYVANMVADGNACAIKLTRAEAGQAPTDVPEDAIEVRRWKRGFDEGSSFCD